MAMSAVDERVVSVEVCETVDVVNVVREVVDPAGRRPVNFVPLMIFVIFPSPLPPSSSPSFVVVVAVGLEWFVGSESVSGAVDVVLLLSDRSSDVWLVDVCVL